MMDPPSRLRLITVDNVFSPLFLVYVMKFFIHFTTSFLSQKFFNSTSSYSSLDYKFLRNLIDTIVVKLNKFILLSLTLQLQQLDVKKKTRKNEKFGHSNLLKK